MEVFNIDSKGKSTLLISENCYVDVRMICSRNISKVYLIGITKDEFFKEEKYLHLMGNLFPDVEIIEVEIIDNMLSTYNNLYNTFKNSEDRFIREDWEAENEKSKIMKELVKTLTNKVDRNGYIMIPSIKGFDLYKIPEERLRNYLVMEGLTQKIEEEHKEPDFTPSQPNRPTHIVKGRIKKERGY